MSLKISPITMAIIFSLSIVSSNLSVAQNMGEVSDTNNNLVGISTAQENKDLSDNLDVITINDPVATYNGIPISKKEFLDYMEGQTSMRSEEFFDETSLETSLKIYLLQKHKVKISEELGLTQREDNILEKQLIKQAMLSSGALSKELISAEELETKKTEIEDVPLDILKVFASVSYPSIDFEEIKDNDELQKVIQDSYKTEKILSSIAESEGLDLDDQFTIHFDGAMLNFWSKKFDELYIDNLTNPTQEELDDSFKKWTETQDFNRYKISHIYLNDKVQAQEILKKIQNREISFAEAAEKYSLDKNSKMEGGKLQKGWWTSFLDYNMPLAKAARELEPGSLLPYVIDAISEGYFHIVFLEEIEKNDVPEEYVINDSFRQSLWKEYKLEEKNNSIISQYQIMINKRK